MNVVEVVVIASYIVSFIAALILSVYFFREYFRKKLRASIAWAFAFLGFAVMSVSDISITAMGGEEVAGGGAVLILGMLFLTFTMTLFYYGTSLLFFNPGSFFREKMTAIIGIVYIIFSFYLVITIPVEGFRDAVAPYLQLLLMTPLYFVIAVLFYRVSRRLPSDDPRRRTVFFVSAGWFLQLINSIYRGAFLDPFGASNAFFVILSSLGMILILYGLALGKAART